MFNSVLRTLRGTKRVSQLEALSKASRNTKARLARMYEKSPLEVPRPRIKTALDRIGDLRVAQQNVLNPKTSISTPGGDKMNRILQRLERIKAKGAKK